MELNGIVTGLTAAWPCGLRQERFGSWQLAHAAVGRLPRAGRAGKINGAQALWPPPLGEGEAAFLLGGREGGGAYSHLIHLHQHFP